MSQIHSYQHFHKINYVYFHSSGAFYFGKNVRSFLALLSGTECCVAAIGAVRFSVCVASVAHTFLL